MYRRRMILMAAAVAMIGVLVWGWYRESQYNSLTMNQLLALHANPNADIDPNVLERTIKRSLESLPTDELIQQWLELPKSNIDYQYPSLADQIVENSLVVHGRVTNVSFNRQDLIEQIIGLRNEGVSTDISLEVLRQHPESQVLDKLTYQTHLTWEYLNFVMPGLEYIFAFRLDGERLQGGGVTSVYRVRGGAVDLAAGPASIPLPEMWDMVAGIRSAGADNGKPPTPAGEEWLARLASGSLDESLVAIEYLDSRPGVQVDPAAVVDAIELQYRRLRPRLPNYHESQQDQATLVWVAKFHALALAGISTLTRLADPKSTDRIHSLYVRDVTENLAPMFPEHAFGDPMVALVLAVPERERADRLRDLFSKSGTVKGEGGQAPFSLLDRKVRAIQSMKDVEGDDIDAFLREMSENPEAFHLRDYEVDAVDSILKQRQETSRS